MIDGWNDENIVSDETNQSTNKHVVDKFWNPMNWNKKKWTEFPIPTM
jgi:hypothetical protein